MKPSLIILICSLAAVQATAQDYLIGFTGTGGSTTVDSVRVRNLTQNTGLTINGPDLLHLLGVVGLDPATGQRGTGPGIHPNPVADQGFIEFETDRTDPVTLRICDFSGRTVASLRTRLTAGSHTATVSGLPQGIYTVSISTPAGCFTGKIVCTGNAAGKADIRILPGAPQQYSPDKPANSQSQVVMQYNDGDQLIFTCFAGTYTTVVPMVPVQSQTVSVVFTDCTDSGNRHYATVSVGGQIWMAENLQTGIRIDGTQEMADNGIIEKYCYNDDTIQCHLYGGLYQWKEMMQYGNSPGAQGICPSGWHLPDENDWCNMTLTTDPTVNCNDPGWSGSVAGGKNKSTGTLEAGTGLWRAPNNGATNETGFSALPSGCRPLNGQYNFIGYNSYWWSSSEFTATSAWYRQFSQVNPGVQRLTLEKGMGLSVRCLKD